MDNALHSSSTPCDCNRDDHLHGGQIIQNRRAQTDEEKETAAELVVSTKPMISKAASSSIASAATDNVPLAAVMGNILKGMENTPDFQWWVTIFGTNLGGNFTPIGSASTVVAVAIIHRAKLTLSFVGFVKKAAPFAIAQLILATGYVLIVLK